MTIIATPNFEIKVALVGYVSVGKTTLLNALFRKKYGEVAMRRATASVNHYRVSKCKPGNWTPNEAVQEAKEALDQTIQDNARLRTSDVVEEVFYDIELDHDIVPEMRDDTRLVIVDIPGINEAGTSSKYKDYVSNNWHTFDCVVVVLDGRQGVNTEEQVELLKLARTSCEEIKSVPIIVVCNKIDDPEDEEQALLVKDVRKTVQEIFETEDQEYALAAVTQGSFLVNSCHPYAVVVPLSAVHAFIYQAGNGVDFEEFKRFDLEYVEKLGKDNFGMKWRRYSKGQKFEKAFEVVSDEVVRQDGLELSNFTKFSAALSFFVSGKDTQTKILKLQIETQLSRLSTKQALVLADQIEEIHTKSKGLYKSTEDLPKYFWRIFDEIVENSFDAFKTPADVHLLAGAMNQLFHYVQFAKRAELSDQARLALKKAKTIVGMQAEVILNQFDCQKQTNAACLVVLYGSFLLQSGESFFYENFGLLKFVMEDRLRNAGIVAKSGSCPSEYCNGVIARCTNHGKEAIWTCVSCGDFFTRRGSTSCPYRYMRYWNHDERQYEEFGYYCNAVDRNGNCDVCGFGVRHYFVEEETGSAFPTLNIVDGVPIFADKAFIPVSVPDSLEDPNHFGHLVWQFGRIFKAVKDTTNSGS